MRVKLLQSYLTFCYPMECSAPGSSVHGFLQARILELAAALLQVSPDLRASNLHVLRLCIGRQALPLVPPGDAKKSWVKLNSHSQEMLKLGRE